MLDVCTYAYEFDASLVLRSYVSQSHRWPGLIGIERSLPALKPCARTIKGTTDRVPVLRELRYGTRSQDVVQTVQKTEPFCSLVHFVLVLRNTRT